VAACPTCGKEIAGEFAFCPFCGAALADQLASAREQRKVVTVVFCDVTGSTALGESTDPEALRALLAGYFERMKGVVERHGGTVEKFIGDAVMAVFGVPVAHEDDALRACRAAVEMRDALPSLGINGRIGVNTGEVVTGTAERLATGDAVNVAARLEQAAQPGEVLVGSETLRLVRPAAEVGEQRLLELKGKAEAVAAWPLVAAAGELERRLSTRMVGRERELTRLRSAFDQAEHDRSCQLFTVLGSAGVGKSRLAAEFLGSVEASVVRGRCLSYGEGITYWPVVEILKQFATLPEGDAARPLRALLGETEDPASAEEVAWAFRKLLEQEAQLQPVVCVLDDLHWAEETLLDLVEHIADLSRDAPLLLLCMARPELLERRPSWGGGKWNATTVLLEPLDAGETELLLTELGGVADALRERIVQVAEGNPLFLEEVLALVRDSADGRVEVPPTIQALLAARLDQLDPAERSVLERGSVEGRTFHRGAVAALAEGDGYLDQRLLALVRKELVRPDRALLPGDDAYRFRHLLIRDAAYDALPKATRAEMHGRFAGWLERHGGELVELDEILGYHLEQAARYLDELGRPDSQLALAAGDRLAAAGRRALWRRDVNAAAGLLERSLLLTRSLRFDLHLELDLAAAEGLTPRRAAEIASATAERAAAVGDVAGEGLARIVSLSYTLQFERQPTDELAQLARVTLPLLEDTADHHGLVQIWSILGQDVANNRGRWADQADAAEQARRHARLAGQPSSGNFGGQNSSGNFGLEFALVLGPTPADEALRRLDDADTHAGIGTWRGWLLAMLDRVDEGRELALPAAQHMRELGSENGLWPLAEIEILAGNHEAAALHLRTFCDWLELRESYAYLSTYAPHLGRQLCALGRYEEAEPLARRGRELSESADAVTEALWRQVEALVCAHRGEHGDAERLAREAIAIIETTDGLRWQGDAHADLATVLEAAGRRDEAAAALRESLDRYERKQALPFARRTRERLAARETARP
jgi:class 3 adenylate cyclase/tetratricopeptide (TPR) repeat protein